MPKLYRIVHVLIILCGMINPATAGKLAIVIDDFGYRPHTENQILALSPTISVSVLPNAPYARQMAVNAHALGHEVLIHLPMAPLSKQPLEKDTLFPEMSIEEIQRIIQDARRKVPYAVGMNNHMGSAMTSSLVGMRKVMQVLNGQNLFFLDSKTIGKSQVKQAATGTSVQVIQRDVFLDDSQREADIRKQVNLAIMLARRNGSAIAIGHPHPPTVKVLQQILSELPADIRLVTVDNLLTNQQSKQQDNSLSKVVSQPAICRLPQPVPPVPASRFLALLWQGMSEIWQDLQKN